MFFGTIELVVWQKYGLPHITIVGPKHIFWWYKTTMNSHEKDLK